jgi:hypothetical protein
MAGWAIDAQMKTAAGCRVTMARAKAAGGSAWPSTTLGILLLGQRCLECVDR